MFYNVIAYCINYLGEMITERDRLLSVPVTANSSIRHLAMSTTKVAG
jgi:hypothetical protein